MLDWACACAKDGFWFGYDKIPKLSDLPITSSVRDAESRVRARAKKTNSDSDMTKSPNLGIYPSLVQCEMLNRTCACVCAKDGFWFRYDEIPKFRDLPITSSVSGSTKLHKLHKRHKRHKRYHKRHKRYHKRHKRYHKRHNRSKNGSSWFKKLFWVICSICDSFHTVCDLY
jgi:hypothetical protein